MLKKKTKRRGGFLYLLLFLQFIFIYGMYLRIKKQGSFDKKDLQKAALSSTLPVVRESSFSSEDDAEKKIDLYLKMENERQRFLKARGDVEAQKALSEKIETFDPSLHKSFDPVYGSLIDEDLSAEEVEKDLQEFEGPREPMGLEESLDFEQKKKQILEDYQKLSQKEYVRQFLENARAQGFDIQLNKNLEIVNIQRIPVRRVPLSTSGPSLKVQGGGSK
ncbi:MAG: hypothetical protein D6797_05400 [Bdellovibrio sp.]|nr:MAG: hypothetical protein D6797_05400 [Bdellovibrio sp.]